MRFDQLITVVVVTRGEFACTMSLAAFFRERPEIGPEERRDIRGALAARITWQGGGDPGRPAWTLRHADALAERSAA